MTLSEHTLLVPPLQEPRWDLQPLGLPGHCVTKWTQVVTIPQQCSQEKGGQGVWAGMSSAFKLEQLSMSHCVTHPCLWEHPGAACHCAPCPTMGCGTLQRDSACKCLAHLYFQSFKEEKPIVCNQQTYLGFLKVFFKSFSFRPLSGFHRGVLLSFKEEAGA